MDALTRIGINPELTGEDLVLSLLLHHSEDQLCTARNQLFEETKGLGLAHPKDILVKRLKRANGPSLKKKFAQDVAELAIAIKNEQPVPRVLLKNGKPAASAFAESRERRLSIVASSPTQATHTSESLSAECTALLSEPSLLPLTQPQCPVSLGSNSILMEEIN